MKLFVPLSYKFEIEMFSIKYLVKTSFYKSLYRPDIKLFKGSKVINFFLLLNKKNDLN